MASVAPNGGLDIFAEAESAAELFEQWVYLNVPHRADYLLNLFHAAVAEVVSELVGQPITLPEEAPAVLPPAAPAASAPALSA